MTNAKVINYNQFVNIEDHELYEGGLNINYTLFGNDLKFIANAEQTAGMLKELNYIQDYSGSGNDVTVEYERDYSYVDHAGEYQEKMELVHQHWEEFIADFTFSECDALSVAALHEAKKQAEREAQVFGDTMETMQLSILGGLSWDEVMCWRELKKVQGNTIWGHSIRLVQLHSTPESIKQLIREMGEAAEESGGTMVHTIGQCAYDYLIKLKTA